MKLPLSCEGQRRLRGAGGAHPVAHRCASGGGPRCGAAPLGHGTPYAPAAAAVPRGAGRDRQDAEGWDARRVGPGHESAGPGRRVDCRGVSLSVGGGAVFRWVKCVLGCRHLLSQGINGVRIQVYAAFIASLLISLWVGRAPTKRTYEMLCFYLSGWATETELIAHIDRLHLKAPPPCKN